MPVERPDFSYIGPERLLTSTKAAILNSRQSKYPLGTDRWIEGTARAVEYAVERDLTVLTSVGMNTWEMVLALTSRLDGNAVIVMPGTAYNSESVRINIARRFNLRAEAVGLFVFEKAVGKKEWLPRRDRFVVESADCIIPVSVRPGGNLARLTEENSTKEISDYRIQYEKPGRPRPRYDQCDVNPKALEDGLIVHFTRSRNSPWPDETEYEFYGRMLSSKDEYCHSAKNSLIHILVAERIATSSRGIRDKHKVVGFTALNAENVRELFRYRPRLVNPYFEPYGIGLPKKTAIGLGLRPVIYGTPDVYSLLKEKDHPYFQNAGRHDQQWLRELEWRCEGDFLLDCVPKNELTVVVGFADEVGQVEPHTRERVMPLFLGRPSH